MLLQIKEYKNYKELCEENGQKVKTGKSKQLHMAEIERFNNIEKVGNKIIVYSHKEVVENKIDGRVNNKGGNNSKYVEYIDQLVIDMLIRNNGSICDSKNNILAEYLGIVNNSYLKYNRNQGLIASDYKVSEFSATQYMMQINSTLNGMFEGSLKRLAKNGVIWFEKTCMLKVNGLGDVLANEYDKNFNDTIIEIEEQILDNFECTRKELRYNDELRADFYNNVNLTLQEATNKEVWGYYNVYNIHLLQDKSSFAIDMEQCAKSLTDELLLASHKGLSKKTNKDGSYIWLTHKLSTFVVMFEKKIFTYANGNIVDRDIFAFSVAKLRVVQEKSKNINEYQEECNEICTF